MACFAVVSEVPGTNSLPIRNSFGVHQRDQRYIALSVPNHQKILTTKEGVIVPTEYSLPVVVDLNLP